MRRAANVASHGQTCEFNGSNSLTKREDSQLPADDFKPGFRLEEGEFVKRRIYPPGRLEGDTLLTSRPGPFGESSVDPRHGSELLPTGSGMIGYPAPAYPEQRWVVDSAHTCKVS